MDPNSHQSLKLDLTQVPTALKSTLDRAKLTPSDPIGQLLIAQWHLLKAAAEIKETNEGRAEANEQAKVAWRDEMIDLRRQVGLARIAIIGDNNCPGGLVILEKKITDILGKIDEWRQSTSASVEKATTAADGITAGSQIHQAQLRVLTWSLVGAVTVIAVSLALMFAWAEWKLQEAVGNTTEGLRQITRHVDEGNRRLAVLEKRDIWLPETIEKGADAKGRTYYHFINEEGNWIWARLPDYGQSAVPKHD